MSRDKITERRPRFSSPNVMAEQSKVAREVSCQVAPREARALRELLNFLQSRTRQST